MCAGGVCLPPCRSNFLSSDGERKPAPTGKHRADNAMLRYKRIIGDSLKARKIEAQITETRIAASVLNRMTTLGKSNSVAVIP